MLFLNCSSEAPPINPCSPSVMPDFLTLLTDKELASASDSVFSGFPANDKPENSEALRFSVEGVGRGVGNVDVGVVTVVVE